MADLRLMLLVAAALMSAACDRQPNPPQSSVTVKLPPARPATARPGFNFGPHQPEARPIPA